MSSSSASRVRRREILRNLDPKADCIRWLDLEVGQNTIDTESLRAFFQHPVDTDVALQGAVFHSGLGEALVRHNVSLPSRVDALVELRRPESGYTALLLEAKSGNQGYDAAVFQLMCYRKPFGSVSLVQ